MLSLLPVIHTGPQLGSNPYPGSHAHLYSIKSLQQSPAHAHPFLYPGADLSYFRSVCADPGAACPFFLQKNNR